MMRMNSTGSLYFAPLPVITMITACSIAFFSSPYSNALLPINIRQLLITHATVPYSGTGISAAEAAGSNS
jgi:hypothetical protein